MNNRKILYFAFPIMILFIGLLWFSNLLRNRYSVIEQSDTPMAETDGMNSEEIGPVIVAKVEEQSGKMVFSAKDLASGLEFPELDLPPNSWSFDQPVLADKSVLSIFGDNANSLRLYRVTSGGSSDSLQLTTRDFGTGLFWGKYLLVIPPKPDLFQIISPNFDQYQISFKSKYLTDDDYRITNVFEALNGRLIAFSHTPVHEIGQHFALVWVIEHATSTIEEHLIPFLDYESSLAGTSACVEQMQNVSILAISQDFTNIVYTYFYSKDNDPSSMYPAYAVYSTTEKRDLVIVKDRFFLPKFDQTGDIIYQEKYRTNGSGGVILNLSDLSPVVDIDQFVPRTADSRTHICPYGSNWLVGSDTDVFVVSSSGMVIKQYSLPPDFIGTEYQLVKPVTE